MKLEKYGEDFEMVWAAFSGKFGSKGAKKLANKEFLALEVDSDDLAFIVNAVRRQHSEKEALSSRGLFSPAFQEVHRYLRNRRFSDAPDERATEKALPRSDQRKRAAAERYLAKHMAGDMDAPGSNQTNLGGTGQLNLRVLENKS